MDVSIPYEIGQAEGISESAGQGEDDWGERGGADYLGSSETSGEGCGRADLRREIVTAWRCFREGKREGREGRARGFYRHEQGKNSLPKSSGIKSGRNLRSDAVTGEKSG
jgi:hypothetical protein